jgi:hypothetical protein
MQPARTPTSHWPLIVATLLAACAARPQATRAVIDPETGVSMIVVEQPIVLARERRDIAANARDYLTLVAAEINDAGRRRLIWVAHQWSTIDVRASDFRPAPDQRLLIVADGRDLRLVPLRDSTLTAYLRHPALLRPEDADVITTFYACDLAMLEFVATSRRVTASYPDSFALPFALWRDGRPALGRLVDVIGDKRPSGRQ